MTTYTLYGSQVVYDPHDHLTTGLAEVSIAVPSRDASFSYSIVGHTDRVPLIAMDGTPQQLLLNGAPLSADEGRYDSTMTIARIEWAGNVTTGLLLSYEDASRTTTTDVFFTIDGTHLPTFGSVSAWESFSETITAIVPATGDFAPGADIHWSDFSTATVTENDVFYGTPDNDTLLGGIGNDIFFSSAGKDTYDGGKGIDEIDFSQDALTGGLSATTVNLKAGYAIDGFGDRDTLKQFEDVRGTDYADKITGSGAKNLLQGEGGNDVLKGQGGKDTLEGGDGRDKLDGGNGDDTLTGGGGIDKLNGGGGNDDLYGSGGNDKFIFKGKFGDDTIHDFQTAGSKEKIDLRKVGAIDSFGDLTNHHLSEVDGNAVIDDGSGNTITLEGVHMADLSANDFLF